MRFIRDQTRSRGKSSLIFYQGFLSIPGLSMTHFVASVNTKVIIRTKQSLTHTFERDGPPGKGLHTITWRVVIPLFVSLRTEGSINRNRVRETKGHLSRKISNSRAIATNVRMFITRYGAFALNLLHLPKASHYQAGQEGDVEMENDSASEYTMLPSLRDDDTDPSSSQGCVREPRRYNRDFVLARRRTRSARVRGYKDFKGFFA